MNNLNIAYAALLHDIGKFYQRTKKISLLNSQEIASTPIHANMPYPSDKRLSPCNRRLK